MDNNKSRKIHYIVRIIMICLFLPCLIFLINLNSTTSFCFPDSGDTVYITKYGHKYHKYYNCSALKNSNTVESIIFDKYGEETIDLDFCSLCLKKEGSKQTRNIIFLWLIVIYLFCCYISKNFHLFLAFLFILIVLIFYDFFIPVFGILYAAIILIISVLYFGAYIIKPFIVDPIRFLLKKLRNHV